MLVLLELDGERGRGQRPSLRIATRCRLIFRFDHQHANWQCVSHSYIQRVRRCFEALEFALRVDDMLSTRLTTPAQWLTEGSNVATVWNLWMITGAFSIASSHHWTIRRIISILHPNFQMEISRIAYRSPIKHSKRVKLTTHSQSECLSSPFFCQTFPGRQRVLACGSRYHYNWIDDDLL